MTKKIATTTTMTTAALPLLIMMMIVMTMMLMRMMLMMMIMIIRMITIMTIIMIRNFIMIISMIIRMITTKIMIMTTIAITITITIIISLNHFSLFLNFFKSCCVSSLSTINKSILPTKRLQTITEEDMFSCDEQIIDVVAREANIMTWSQERRKSVRAPGQGPKKPEKHVIESLMSSPEHLNHFDLSLESDYGLNLKRYTRSKGRAESANNDFAQKLSTKSLMMENHQQAACENVNVNKTSEIEDASQKNLESVQKSKCRLLGQKGVIFGNVF